MGGYRTQPLLCFGFSPVVEYEPTGPNFRPVLYCSMSPEISKNVFLLRATALLVARICYGNSVRLSVCLSVRPSHGWISQKRLKLGSCNFHHTVAPSL